LDFEFVLEAGDGFGKGSAAAVGEDKRIVVEGAGTGWRGVVAERGVAGGVVVFSSGLAGVCGWVCSGRGGGFFVAFFLDGRKEFLENGEAHEGAKVGEAADGDEDVDDFLLGGFLRCCWGGIFFVAGGSVGEA
jgi:hypothetical protein